MLESKFLSILAGAINFYDCVLVIILKNKLGGEHVRGQRWSLCCQDKQDYQGNKLTKLLLLTSSPTAVYKTTVHNILLLDTHQTSTT